MKTNPLAEKPPEPGMLVNALRLITAYCTGVPALRSRHNVVALKTALDPPDDSFILDKGTMGIDICIVDDKL